MGHPADENLPEVVANPNHPNSSPPALDPSPEVLSPEDVASHLYFSIDREKYPAHFDDAPKLPYDPNGEEWPMPVSALSPGGAPWESLPAGDTTGEESATKPDNGVTDKERRICGMRRRNVIIVVVVLIVVIAAAVGGGVAGAKARSGSESGTSSEAESKDLSSTSQSPATSPTSQPSTTSTTSSTLPTTTVEFLNNQTGVMGLAFQGFGEANYLGNTTGVLRAEGFYDFAYEVKSYVWLPNNTDCCVTFCADKNTSVGWRCQMRYRAKTEDGTGFPRMNIWCTGRGDTDKYSKMCS